jgi:hypothetical protein
LGDGVAPSLGTFDINVNFDPTILEFSDVHYEDPILGNQLDLFGLGSSVTTTPGVGVINLFELSRDPPGDLNALQAKAFILAQVTFNALAAGASPLSLTTNALGDASGNPITAVVGGGSIGVVGRSLSALSPAKVWVGLKNSDDVGTYFDLLAEVFLDTTKIGEGQLNGVSGGSSGFNNAGLYTIPLTLSAPVEVPGNAAFKLKLSVRVAANSRHRSGTARLWYNGQPLGSGKKGEKRDAGTRFNATIAGMTVDYFLRENSTLSSTPGSSMKFIDVGVDRARNGNPFTQFGVWSLTLP